MHRNPRIDSKSAAPFQRLATLLGDAKPGREPVAVLTIGEPQLPAPALILPALAGAAALWNKYPPAQGTPEFRAAVAGWLTRRYGLTDGMLAADRMIAPCSGTREGLFLLGQAAIPERIADARPAVLMPNPFYHVYETTARLAGAEPVYLAAGDGVPDFPDVEAIPEALLARTAALFLCSPANPQGAVAPLPYLVRLLARLRAHGGLLVLDECYSEIYASAPPPGGLQAAALLGPGPRGGPFDNLMVFHSLSKRSSAPGLRSGFLAGDPQAIAAFTQLVGAAGCPTPLPILAAATALWSDEAHVEAARAVYRANFALAAARFASRGWVPPGGGFYLWLDVGDGEATALRLWRDHGVRVMPGAYMAAGDGVANPGHRFIRVALVQPPEIMEAALDRLAAAL